jgi:hypothetical protein
MVERFLPSLRLLVARALRSQGYSQTKVSSLLGITQASVSLYDSSGPAKAYDSLATISVTSDDADRYVSVLCEDLKRNSVYAVATLGTIWRSLLGSGAVCGAHRSAYPSLSGCDVCMREYGAAVGGRTEAVTQVADAAKLVESSPTFVSVMPEVSVNIAFLADDSDSPKQVVAIPGRIVRVRNSARAMQPPALGSSEHLARVLLLVRKRRAEFRAAMNLRYDSRMASVLKSIGLRPVRIGGYSALGGGDPTLEALAARLLNTKKDFDVVVDSGTKGIEPNVYLFGRDAIQVARLAVNVSEVYSTR